MEVARAADLDRVMRAVEALGLSVADRNAQRAALFISVVMLVFGTISVVIVAIAGLSVMHVFFMLGAQRQHEIGVMRGVGATRGDIRTVFLLESSAIGLAAGMVGVGLAVAAGEILDLMARSRLPDFPFKPESFFQFSPFLIGGVLLFAIAVCLLGALLPAQRAAAMDPARVLAGR